MTKKVLTDTAIKRLQPPATGQLERFDAALPGFGVRVSYRGTKSFILMYRINGRQRRATVGHYPVLTLAQARDKARDILQTAAAGKDPRAEQAVRDIEAMHAHADTFEAAVAEFIEKHAKAKKSNRTWKDQQRVLMNANQRWHSLPVTSITRRDLHDALDGAMTDRGPYIANRTHAALSTFFRWLHSRDRILENPMDRVPRPFDGERARERVWSDDELKAIWKGADKLDAFTGAYLRLLLLMGQRKNEVGGMKWTEIDLEAGTWTLPPDRHKAGHKTGRGHAFPLPPIAVRVLRGLPRVARNAFVFPGRGTLDGKPRPMTIGTKIQGRIQAVSTVTDFTFHDARRTFRTGLDRLNIPPHVKDECLNHARRGVGDTHYSQYDYLDEQRTAFEAWSQHIEGLVHGGNVVGLRG